MQQVPDNGINSIMFYMFYKYVRFNLWAKILEKRLSNSEMRSLIWKHSERTSTRRSLVRPFRIAFLPISVLNTSTVERVYEVGHNLVMRSPLVCKCPSPSRWSTIELFTKRISRFIYSFPRHFIAIYKSHANAVDSFAKRNAWECRIKRWLDALCNDLLLCAFNSDADHGAIAIWNKSVAFGYQSEKNIKL